VRGHQAVAFRTAYLITGDASEAEDAAQEALVTAYRKLDTFRGEAAFRTWLLRIAWREAQDRRRSLRRRLRRFVSLGQPEEACAAICSPPQEHVVGGAELRGYVRRLLAGLPASLREPLLLAASEEHTYAEMAVILGVPEGTLKWRVAEGRRRLRERLLRVGYRDA
jgi:RNA polymerase sigma-70 factor (ECF subfamily)